MVGKREEKQGLIAPVLPRYPSDSWKVPVVVVISVVSARDRVRVAAAVIFFSLAGPTLFS